MLGDSMAGFFKSLDMEVLEVSHVEVAVEGGGLRSFFLRFRGLIIRGRLFSEWPELSSLATLIQSLFGVLLLLPVGLLPEPPVSRASLMLLLLLALKSPPRNCRNGGPLL